MSTPPFETYRLHFTPLSPVHIGSGLSIEPYEYLIEKDAQGAWFLHVLDLPRLIADLHPKQRETLDKANQVADFPRLRSWLRKNAKVERHTRYSIQVQDAAAKEIQDIADDPNNKGEIHLACRWADTGVPYIPGSSIKGAIRTAVIDRLLNPLKKSARALAIVNGDRPKATHLEAMAMGNEKNGSPDLYSDPFRQLAISDIDLQPDSCYIDRIKIIRPPKKEVSGRGSQEKIIIFRDMTWSLLDGESLTYRGEARLFTSLAEEKDQAIQKPVSRPLKIPDIIEACNDYYRPEVERQLDTFTPRDEENDAEIREPLLKAVEDLRDDECVIRVGRHTHFECITFLEPFRKPPKKGFGKTRSYAGGSLPLGWAKLRFEKIG